MLVFYAVSPVIAANNERYNAFFSESIPFGEKISGVIEDRGLDEKLRLDFLKRGKEKVQKIFDDVSKKAASGPPAAEKTEEVKKSVTGTASKVASSDKAVFKYQNGFHHYRSYRLCKGSPSYVAGLSYTHVLSRNRER